MTGFQLNLLCNESLEVLDDLHSKIFEAIHKEKTLSPVDEAGAIKWIATNAKLDTDKVKAAFKSFSMEAKLKKLTKCFEVLGPQVCLLLS